MFIAVTRDLHVTDLGSLNSLGIENETGLFFFQVLIYVFIIHDDCDDASPEHFELELQIELIETTRTFKNKEKKLSHSRS